VEIINEFNSHPATSKPLKRPALLHLADASHPEHAMSTGDCHAEESITALEKAIINKEGASRSE
jgi:hypothetical protein